MGSAPGDGAWPGGSFLCETTVLLAASDAAHRHHERSLALVTGAEPARAHVAANSLAELYATLSAAPGRKIRRVDQVLQAVEHVARSFTPVTLDPEDYLWVLRHVAGAGARSGQIYDALILKCAERAGVDAVFTWNTAHFMRVAWPGMAQRIRTP
ncbi:MAG: type II toxin-antitoxin system VapC family toxin [Gemmatimonadetes bacterium]|nr:type II toxin-antitoxin system VapC family toxin [Gemmatimonadota bacterium]